MIIQLDDQTTVELRDFVSMRLKHELQQIYWRDQELASASGTEPTVTTSLKGARVLEAQDHAVKSLVVKFTNHEQEITDPDKIFQQLLDLPSALGETVYAAVNQLLTASNQPVPKV